MSGNTFARRMIDALSPRGPIVTPASGLDLDNLLEGLADGHQSVLDDLERLAYVRDPWKCPTALLGDLEREFGITPNVALTEKDRRANLAESKYRRRDLATVAKLQRVLDRAGFGTGGYGLRVTPNVAGIPEMPDDPAGTILRAGSAWPVSGMNISGGVISVVGGKLIFTSTTTSHLVFTFSSSALITLPIGSTIRFRVRKISGTFTGGWASKELGTEHWSKGFLYDGANSTFVSITNTGVGIDRIYLSNTVSAIGDQIEISDLYIGDGSYLPWHAPADPSSIIDNSYELTAHEIGDGSGSCAGNSGAYAAKRGGYYLVNGDSYSLAPKYPQAGQICARAFDGSDSKSGEESAGNYTNYSVYMNEYTSPPEHYWALIFFVGGTVSYNEDGSVAAITPVWIPAARRQELHRLILRIKPVGIWAAMVVQYQ